MNTYLGYLKESFDLVCINLKELGVIGSFLVDRRGIVFGLFLIIRFFRVSNDCTVISNIYYL